MDGDIELRPGESRGRVRDRRHRRARRGEPKRSYRSPAHSSGQKAKISLLILLAAMGLEGSADLLIMDEHAAHLDSRNIDAVAEVMNALKHRVQFILATPTNAEAARLAGATTRSRSTRARPASRSRRRCGCTRACPRTVSATPTWASSRLRTERHHEDAGIRYRDRRAAPQALPGQTAAPLHARR